MCGIVFSVRMTSSAPPVEPLRTERMISAAAPPSSTDVSLNSLHLEPYVPESASGDIENPSDYEEDWTALLEAVKGRGPDAQRTLVKHISAGETRQFELRFHAAVLHMRGESITTQPLVADTGDVLLWNGEVFDGLEVAPDENDGQKLFDRIQALGPDNFLTAIRDVEGPYALVFYQASSGRVYFARDPLGRRSLLLQRPTSSNPTFSLVSCPPGNNSTLRGLEEVTCDAVHCYDLLKEGELSPPTKEVYIVSYPRYHPSLKPSPDSLTYPFDRLNTSLPTPSDLPPLPPQPENDLTASPAQEPLLAAFLHELERAVRSRVSTVPSVPPAPAARIAVLFSGGLDCSVVALIADRVLPKDEAIDLVNVAFENPRKVAAAKKALTGTGRGGDGKKEKKVGGKSGKGKAAKVVVGRLEEATNRRTSLGTEASAYPATPESRDDGSSTVDSNNPSSPSSAAPPAPPPPSIYDVPDRLTARGSWEELKRLRPNRRWNLVEVNVPYVEFLEHRQTVVDLMKPQNTVMDLSISIAFWFAARGQGVLSQYSSSPATELTTPPLPPPPPILYHSRARVLLSGLGADELLGGYARHRRAFYSLSTADPAPPPPPRADSPSSTSSTPALSPSAQPLPSSPSDPSATSSSSYPSSGWSNLLSQLQLDLDRLPTRNLGRDDRIVSSQGKEARYPFLAGHVVSFLAEQPVWLKVDPRFPEGVGDKRLLRLLARRLGFGEAAALKKRAIHFGAQTAKMEVESARAKGTDLL